METHGHQMCKVGLTTESGMGRLGFAQTLGKSRSWAFGIETENLLPSPYLGEKKPFRSSPKNTPPKVCLCSCQKRLLQFSESCNFQILDNADRPIIFCSFLTVSTSAFIQNRIS